MRARACAFATLRILSTGSWNDAANATVGTNEYGHENFYKALKGRRGAIIGVSFQQNLMLTSEN